MSKEKKIEKSKALVLSSYELSPQQKADIQVPTPVSFIKERKARGGSKVKYVEGGYVIATLNKIFGVLNWSFEEVDKVESEKEISVLGRLTIHDHKNGYSVKKEQWGQADIQPNVPVGDMRKAAATDALKKCASLFGIALDVYWNQLDRKEKQTTDQEPQKKIITREELLKRGIQEIIKEKDPEILRQMKIKIQESSLFKKYTTERDDLINRINAKLG